MKNNIENQHRMPTISCQTTNFTKNGACSQCGGCCTHHLRMTPTEIKNIQIYIRKNKIRPCIHTNNQSPQIDFLCPFLDTSDETCKCTIYPVRPLICQIFQCNRTHTEMMELASQLLHGKQRLQTQFFSSFECNVGSTFFPDIYLPKQNDFVIFNQINKDLYQKYEGQIFRVIRTDKQTKFTHISPINTLNGQKMRIPTDWLTKVM